MAWLFPSVVATMVGTFILAATFLFLYRSDRQPFLKIWAWAWCLYALRFACMLGYLSLEAAKPVLLIGNQLAALWSGIALLWGTYRFIGRTFPRNWSVFGLLVSAYIVVAGAKSSSILLLSLPIFLFLGWVYLWTGVIFFRQERFPGNLSRTVGFFFVAWGIHKADYPFLRPLVWFAPWGYLLGAVLELCIALGMLMLYFQQARQQLRASEAQYRSIFENAVEGFFQSTPEGKFINVNPAFAEMLGYASPEELIASIEDIGTQYYADPQDRRRYQQLLRDQGKVQNIEYPVKRKDGATIWIANSTRAVHGDDGGIVLYEGTITDITARKQLERRLKRQHYLFEKAQEIGRIGAWELDGATGSLRWSRELYAIFQIEADSPLTYERFLQSIHPDDRESVDRAWQAALAGQAYDIEHRILAGGEIKWIREKAELHHDGAGAFVGAVGFAQDITDRKLAEIERLESTERFKTLYDNAPISYQSLDENGCFVEVNRTWLNILGYERSDVIGRHFSEFLHQDWRDH
ncbi:MAG TPA: PAS domain S-box protein, partial [Desulfosarcina sp.]|nr:PAS domain S-box protein [Desulfosarcina sp.]